MTRGEIRSYIRILADELTEAPEGLFLDTELDLLINISQQKTAVELAPFIPWAITKSFLISTVANKREYDVLADLSVTDLFMFFGIFHNESGYKQTELLYVEKDQLVEYNVIGETGDPKVWSWDSPGVIALDPCPDQSVTSKFKAVYIPVFHDLNQDTTHEPPTGKYAIPFNGLVTLTPTHSLISLDVLKQWHIRGEEEGSDIDQRYREVFSSVISTMSMAQGVTSKMRPELREMIKR
jgi:hypothetical protein